MPAKLLVADDSTTIQKVFERTFPAEEFTLSFANNGEEALAKAKTERPQLIIADTDMPLKNGFELCEAIKNDPALKGTPVLLLHKYDEDFDEDEIRRVGADGFIVKPFEPNTAIGKVREALTKRENIFPTKGPAGGQTAEIKELADIIKKLPAMPPLPQKKQGTEEILELTDIIKESPAMPPSSSQIKKKEEEFVLQSSLRELEAELKAEFSEEIKEEREAPLSQETKKEESLSLKLDLPFDEIEFEPPAKDVDWTGLFGDLGGDLDIEGLGQEIKGERLGTILGESTTELEKIEGLGRKHDKPKEEEFAEKFLEGFEPIFDESAAKPEKIEGLGLKKDKPKEEEFSKKFREPIFGESTAELEKIASLGPIRKENDEEEYAGKFLEDFEPVFGESAAELEKIEGLGLKRDKPKKKEEYAEKFMEDFEPVFETEDDFQRIEILDKDLKGPSEEDKGDLAERVASALSQELKEVVEEVIKNKVPKLVREVMEQSKKE